MRVTNRHGQTWDHRVIGYLRYASGDHLLVTDCPWHSPSDLIYDPDAVALYHFDPKGYDGLEWRGVTAYQTTPFRVLVTSTQVGNVFTYKSRKFTKLDPGLLSLQIICAPLSDVAF